MVEKDATKGTYFFITWRVLESSLGRIYGKSKGVVKELTDFSEATEIASGSRSGEYWSLLYRGSIINGDGR